MAMVVKNNMTAINTLNTLNKNSSALSKSLQKVSSGMKIIVLTLAISLGAAVLFPIEEAAEKEEKPEAETGGSRV